MHVAFQVVGEGPPDLVYIPVGFHHVELTWEFRKRADFLQRLARRWGDLEAMAENVKGTIPSATDEERRQWARIARLSHSPGTAAAYVRANLDVDVRDVLPSIRVPTLVMYRVGVRNAQPNARYLAERIPAARLVELPGSDIPPDWEISGSSTS